MTELLLPTTHLSEAIAALLLKPPICWINRKGAVRFGDSSLYSRFPPIPKDLRLPRRMCQPERLAVGGRQLE